MENMAVFLYILSYNIIPICLLILLGFLLGKRFKLDVFTLSKLNFYLFTPAFLFVNLYNTSFHWELLQVVFCGFSLILVNALLGEVIGRYRNYERSFTNAFKNPIMSSNVGNIGLMAMAGIALWGLSGVAAQIMLIANAVPTAVNTALIAVECKNCPEFAAQTVMVSTLLSVLTLTFFIFLARLIYPVA